MTQPHSNIQRIQALTVNEVSWMDRDTIISTLEWFVGLTA